MTHSCQKLIHQEQRLQVCAHLLFPTDLERCFLISFYRKTFSSPGQRTEPWTARWRLVVMAAGSGGSGGSGLCLPLCVEPRPLSYPTVPRGAVFAAMCGVKAAVPIPPCHGHAHLRVPSANTCDVAKEAAIPRDEPQHEGRGVRAWGRAAGSAGRVRTPLAHGVSADPDPPSGAALTGLRSRGAAAAQRPPGGGAAAPGDAMLGGREGTAGVGTATFG